MQLCYQEFAMNPMSLVNELESIIESLDLTPESRSEIIYIIEKMKSCAETASEN